MRSTKQRRKYEFNDFAFDRTETDERMVSIEDEVCAEFGCNKKLSRTEKLFGEKCIEHQQPSKYSFHNGKL